MAHRSGARGLDSAPAGSNMNDLSYPFRGDYKLDKRLNHGHSGVSKVAPTSLHLRVTGSNLVLEDIHTNESQSVACELGVGHLKPRSVVLPTQQRAFPVLNDNKDYHIFATVQGPQAKHYCKLTLRSSEPTTSGLPVVAHASPPRPQHLQLMAVQGADENCFVSVGSERTRLPLHELATVRLDPSSPVYLHLPKQQGQHSAPAPLHASVVMPHTLPDVDVRVSADPPALVASCPNHAVEITVEYRSTSGLGHCQAQLDPRRAVSAMIRVTDPSTGLTVFRQTLAIPALEGSPAVARVDDTPVGRNIFCTAGSTIAVDSAPAVPGDHGVALDALAHAVVIRQRGLDGSSAAAQLHFTAKSVDTFAGDLARALEGLPADVLRNVSNIRPTTEDQRKILAHVISGFGKPVPRLEFISAPTGLSSMRCDGFTLAANHGLSGAPCVVAQGSSIMHHGTDPVVLTALDPSTGAPAAICKVSVMLAANPEDLLVQKLLDSTLAAHPDRSRLADELSRVRTESVPGTRLLPLLIDMLRAAGTTQQPVVSAAPVLPSPPPPPRTVSLNPRVGEGAAVSVAFDQGPPIILDRPTVVPPQAQQVFLIPSISSDFIPSLIRQEQATSPSSLRDRWAGVQPTTEPERKLHALLLRLLKDQDDGKTSLTVLPAAKIQFSTCEGCLTNIRCDGMQLHAAVDEMPTILLGQGSSIPQSGAFSEGTTHNVRIFAKDTLGNLRAESFVAVTTPYRKRVGVSFLDVSLVPSPSTDTAVRVSCPPQYQLSIEVDQSGGCDYKSNEATLKLDAASAHSVVITVIDETGAPQFRQKFSVPRIRAAPWDIAIDGAAEIIVHQQHGIVVTASADRSPERVVDGPLRLDADSTHQLVLRKFLAATSLPCGGDLLLSMPVMIDANDVMSLIRIFQASGEDRSSPYISDQLMHVHAKTRSGLMKRLITYLVQLALDLMSSGQWREYFDSVTRAIRDTRSQASTTVFFRLKGDEEYSAVRR
jgi:hypothetical protein